MSVINSIPLIAAGDDGYQISRSVRLRSSASAYFSRTPASAGNRKTWTWSGWVKFGDVSTTGRCLFGTLVTSSYTVFGINVSGQGTATIGMESVSGTTTILSRAYTNAVIRDPSAWYHIIFAVDTTNATASDRLKIYFNGVRMSVTEPYAAALNTDHFINQASVNHALMAGYNTSYVTDGYITEVNFIDGQALTPSSFGETDAVTGVWKPKRYTGTYGTNGFYLNFSDNSAATAAAIGKDSSGNGNNWTPNNISVTTGTTYDSMLDVPTPYADGGNGRGNYAVMNPVGAVNGFTRLSTYADGNLNVSSSGAADRYGMATILPSSGKWYVETTVTSLSSGVVGVGTGNSSFGVYNQYFSNSGAIYKNSSSSTTGATFTTGDVIGTAFDVDAGSVSFYKNNTLQATLTGCTDTSAFQVYTSNTTTLGINFGQRPFAYTPPTGFKALNTQNLPDSTIKKGNAYFDATTYTGNGSTQSIVNAGGFQPDFVWVKSRSSGTQSHELFDSVRGISKPLNSSNTNAEVTYSGNSLTAFNSNGFTVVDDATGNYWVNGSTGSPTYVGWQWKANGSAVSNTAGSITSSVSANTTAGFSVVTYTGTGANATIGHGLGVAPKMMILKSRVNARDWPVYHTSIGAGNYLALDTTAASAALATMWNSTAPTSTVFSVGSALTSNDTSMVAYLFAEVAGFSKFGSYTGNGSADGPFVYLGFKPKFVLVKRTDTTGNWSIFDSSRSGYNVDNDWLGANLSNAEADGQTSAFIDLLSNGFKWRNTDTDRNASGGTYIYAAFAENPFKNSLAR